MSTVRTALKCNNPVLKSVTAILFAHDKRHAAPVSVPTAAHPTHDGHATPSFPSFEAVLGADVKLHEAWVYMVDGTGREHRFLIAAQYSPEYEVNQSLKTITPESNWRGGLIIMRGGCKTFVVNLAGSVLKQLAFIAVHKFLSDTAPLVANSVLNNTPLELPVAFDV
ncbi:hypothetical protein C2E23DRAFT_857307 [Lenzites betulinus]|nr:hypothetical protein C2E23DRAFT_857307 [Lenzites betulinus]